ncbi:hypothetical protein [Eubacterium sp. 1001713B170207_170306_E7]|uniref:hypothetical protein n=1 Tax=Eubacterium sp. 1001713B170207_170306_E7 TaxID=2787097 RepID=UPI00189AB981|nr:hypothetical protein [Eubacterium sp. 1001713B170207_170306_E7]
MKKRLSDQSGSALVWVLVICIIFGLLGIAIGSVALSMNNRSIKNNLHQQTYFTARSAVDAFFVQLNGDTSDNPTTALLYQKLIEDGGHAFEVENIDFEDTMGNCSLKATYDVNAKEVTLTATASKGDMTDTVTLKAKYKGNQDGEIWPSKESGIKLNANGGGLVPNLGKDSQVYCLEKSNTKGDTLNFFANNKRKAIFIYVLEGQTLTINNINQWDKTEPDVFIYLEKDAVLKFELKNNAETTYPIYINGDNSAEIIYEGNSQISIYNINTVKYNHNEKIRNLGYTTKTKKSGYNPNGKPASEENDVWQKIAYSTAE